MTDLPFSPKIELHSGLRAESRRLQLKTRRSASGDLLGRYRSSFRGSGLIFSDLRQYQPGDDVKHIHWRATARTSHVYMKSYEEERFLRVVIAIDSTASTLFGGGESVFKRAVDCAALIATLAQWSGDALGFAAFSDQIEEFIEPKASRNHYQRIVSSLISPRPLKKATVLSSVFDSLNAWVRKRSIIFIFSDFVSPPFEDELRRLARRHDVILVDCDAFGTATKSLNSGLVYFSDSEGTGEMLVDTSDPQFISELKNISSDRYAALNQVAKRSGADVMLLDDSPVTALKRLMAERLRRRR